MNLKIILVLQLRIKFGETVKLTFLIIKGDVTHIYIYIYYACVCVCVRAIAPMLFHRPTFEKSLTVIRNTRREFVRY